MRILDKKTSGDAVRLIIFMVVTSLATGVLVVLIGNLTFQRSHDYKAVFSDVTGLTKGSDIRIAGVKVGSVKEIEVIDDDRALVAFDVNRDATVTRSSTATIRFRDLIGQRYISLTQGVGDLGRQPPGSTIPLERTQPALDLTVLFNGFKPLFAALDPAEMNKLNFELVRVFQGQGDSLEGLLRSTGSVTTELAARDELIGDVITNLNAVLASLSSRDRELSTLVIRLRDFVGGLAKDRDALLQPLESISLLTEETAGLTTAIRPDLVQSIKELRTVAGNLKAGRQEIDRALQVLPIKLTKIGRTAIYGSWFNFYMCEFHARVLFPEALPVKGVRVDYKMPAFVNGQKSRCNLT